jgi:ubiquinone/menaquinone biosynthesis C-methylase UbiE
MDAQDDFAQFEREMASWWYIARRNLLLEVAQQELRNKHDARILDMGGTAEFQLEQPNTFKIVSQHSTLASAAFHQWRGRSNLVCSSIAELAFPSNCFDLVLAGDFLQSAADDRAALRELLRVLKDGGLLCLTVPAYSFLWSEEDERRGNCRRYRTSELRRKLTTSGFEVQRASYFVATAFLPVALGQIAKSIVHTSNSQNDGSTHSARIANAAMLSLLALERHLLHYINLPFGTSVICWARKPSLATERITVPAWDRQWVSSPGLTWSGSSS